MKTKTDYPRKVAIALMQLRGLDAAAVAAGAEINHDLLKLFLSGHPSALSEQSFDALFHFLGLQPCGESAVLASSKVHYFTVNCGLFGNRQVFAGLRTIQPLIKGLFGMSLHTAGRNQIFLLRGDETRIVLHVRQPLVQRVSLSDVGIPPGAFRGYDKIRRIPAYYQTLLTTRQLTPRYFDVVLSGNYENESLELIRLAALEHDIPLSEVFTWVAAQARQPAKEESQTDLFVGDVAASNIFALRPEHFARAEELKRPDGEESTTERKVA